MLKVETGEYYFNERGDVVEVLEYLIPLHAFSCRVVGQAPKFLVNTDGSAYTEGGHALSHSLSISKIKSVDSDIVEKLAMDPLDKYEKLDFSLKPTEFDDVVAVLMMGAEKYGANSWLEGNHFTEDKNYASMCRHLREHREGLTADHESGLHPLLHLASRALMEYTLWKRNN